MSEAKMLQSNKERIVAVDITRLLAAFIVMYAHLNMFGDREGLGFLLDFRRALISTVSPVFFVLAGFFACRNISWKKAFNNAWWCFAPYVLWCSFAILLCYFKSPEVVRAKDLPTLFGYGSLVHGLGHGEPPWDGPLWFMRDLTFLFLLSPILLKLCRIVLPVIVLLAIVPATTHLTSHSSATVLSLNSIACFSFGCFLQSLGKDVQKKCLEFHSTTFIITYIVTMTGIFAATHIFGVLPKGAYPGMLYNLVNIVFLYQVARWLEVYFPKVKGIALKYAPVTFLTFAGHMIIYRFLMEYPIPSVYLLALPIVLFVLFSLMFFALKRICSPWMLHLVAHYKLRAEDVRKHEAPAQ